MKLKLIGCMIAALFITSTTAQANEFFAASGTAENPRTGAAAINHQISASPPADTLALGVNFCNSQGDDDCVLVPAFSTDDHYKRDNYCRGNHNGSGCIGNFAADHVFGSEVVFADTTRTCKDFHNGADCATVKLDAEGKVEAYDNALQKRAEQANTNQNRRGALIKAFCDSNFSLGGTNSQCDDTTKFPAGSTCLSECCDAFGGCGF